MLVGLFPGQGAQFRGMGLSVFDKYPDYVDKANKILGYDLEALCLNDSENFLNNTEYTQPALFVVSVLSYLDTLDLAHFPEFMLGHSLGEYAALFAAGSFDFETGLKLVKKRGELMASVTQGSMLVIFGLSKEKLAEYLIENGLDMVDIANHNTKDQLVISGFSNDIDMAESLFENDFYVTKRIKVSGPFHSRHLEQVASTFFLYIDKFDIKQPNIPVISNLTAKPHDKSNIKVNLARQINNMVRWYESISLLIKNYNNIKFYDYGPGNIVEHMVDKIKRQELSK